MSSPAEQIKERLDIVEVISAYLRLEQAGANWRARCPFHQERTPSFFVSPARQSYHCFGCQRGGDIFSFVEEVEGLDFVGALRVLADKAGVELGPTRGRRADEGQERLYRLLEKATLFYQERLTNYPPAFAYLKERGLNAETIEEWRLGWAPDDWRVITDYLIAQGFNEIELEQSGMVGRSPKDQSRVYDRFRGRLMFPLFDNAGRVVAFSGRLFKQGEIEAAKYLNSPATQLYDKSKLLYGFHRAKAAIRRADTCVLVEGQFDLLLSHQAGVGYTVATSGTALTEKHFSEPIKRLTKTLVMAFDADQAGVAASRRAVGVALGQGFELKLAALPSDKDPADLISHDPADWLKLINESQHVIDFFLRNIESQNLSARRRAQVIVTEILPLISQLVSQVDQAFFISRASSLAGVSEEVLWQELKRLKPDDSLASRSVSSAASPVVPPDKNRRQRIEEQILGLRWWRLEELDPVVKSVWSQDLLDRLTAEAAPRKDDLILAAELRCTSLSAEEVTTELEVLLAAWQQETDREALVAVRQRLTEAERRGDEEALRQYLQEFQDLSKRLQ
ncbi:MAG: DNA primase [Patescibacteria group bacterium]|nr:DNA primase [Patescibacteria group bacterium]